MDKEKNYSTIIKEKGNYAEVIKGKLYFGNCKLAKNDNKLRELKIKGIVDLINYKDPSKEINHSNDFVKFSLPVIDKPTNNIEWCEQPSKFIDDQLEKGNKVYVHCSQGISRSSALVIYYLITRENKTLKESFDYLRKIRDVICPIYGFMKNLSELETKKFGFTTFTPEEYSILTLSEVFPKIDINTIKNFYNESKKIVYDNIKFYEEKMKNENIEPIGYLCFDNLVQKFGKESFISRYGCSEHHPFD